MKNAVIFDEYNEIEIKPLALLRKYIQLTKEDVRSLLLEKGGLKECVCVACRSGKVLSTFTKFGMSYRECADCNTLYISPRPDDNAILDYYRSSPSKIFWRGEFSKMTGNKRREKIIRPRIQWIMESTQEYLSQAESFADIGATQYGYIEEFSRNSFFKRKFMINPFLELKNDKCPPGVKIIENPRWEEELKQVDVISLFEVADRISDTDAFFNKVNNCLSKNGLCFLTAILSSGFDVQTLWDKLDKLYPPDRLNVFSMEGLRILAGRHGFECLEFSTPGIFDTEITHQALEQNPGMAVSRFTRYMLCNRNEETRRAFQNFLQENLLSSYGRILLRKTG